MATKQTPKIRTIKKQYTRGEILESLVYELKPFVIAAAGFAGAVYFTQNLTPIGKYFSLALMGCGLFILYWRAKDRGIIE
jgi:hypothetical protein